MCSSDLVPNRTKVKVILRPYHWPEVAVEHNDVVYLASPIQTLAGGFDAEAAVIGEEFKAQPETTIQRSSKRSENLAYGEERKKDDVPFAGTLQVFGHQAEKLGNLTPMPKVGTPLEVGRDTVAKEMSLVEFLKQLRGAVSRIEPALNRELKTTFGSSIEVKLAERIIADIDAGRDWRDQIDGADQRQAL